MAVSFVQFRERILKPVLEELQKSVKRINVSHSKSFKGCFFFFSSINAWMPDFYFKLFLGFSVAAGLYLSGTLCPELHIDLH